MGNQTRFYIALFLKGAAMGVADAVPGVSGGTIAVISGIYEQLVDALKRCNPLALKILRREGPAAFWRHIHGSFLLTLGAGILSSLVVMANLVLFLLDNFRPFVMVFFMGLVLASCWRLRQETVHWSLDRIALFLLGFCLTAATALLNPVSGSTGYGYLFVCGMVAICAMILPGISGAFILILLGVYEFVLDALRSADLAVITVFAAGCAIGLLSFSHVLSWTFFYYRDQTYALLTGMLAASLIVLWPGSAAVSSYTLMGQAALFLCALAGMTTIFVFQRLSR